MRCFAGTSQGHRGRRCAGRAEPLSFHCQVLPLEARPVAGSVRIPTSIGDRERAGRRGLRDCERSVTHGGLRDIPRDVCDNLYDVVPQKASLELRRALKFQPQNGRQPIGGRG